MSKVFSKVESFARRQAQKRNWIVLAAQLATTVFIPVVVVGLFNFKDQLDYAFWWILIPTLLLQLVLAGLVISSTRNERFFFDHLDLNRELDDKKSSLEKAKRDLKQLEYSRGAIHMAISGLNEFISHCNSVTKVEEEEVRKHLEILLSAAVELRRQTFNFTSGAKHNFAVYLFSEEANELECFYRVVDDRISTQNRSWKPGHGHIGLCYLWEELLISPDIVEASELSRNMTEEDQENYRSLASTPIFSLNTDEETERARGVFIVTSSAPNQLSERKHESLMLILGAILTLFFHIADQHTSYNKSEDYV